MANNPKLLEGKNIIVTGASTGIGKAIALEVASAGARVFLVGRNKIMLQDVNSKILEQGGKADVIVADLSDEKEIERLVIAVLKSVKQIDVLFNVAGVWHNEKELFFGKRLDEIPLDRIDYVLNVTLLAPMLLSSLVLKAMIPLRKGKIINISGMFSKGGAKWLHYYVSKKGLESFTKGLADEVREFEIQVNCISPSDVATDPYNKFYPEDVKLALKPNEVAELALWLASDLTEHISGQVIFIKNKTDYSPSL